MVSTKRIMQILDSEESSSERDDNTDPTCSSPTLPTDASGEPQSPNSPYGTRPIPNGRLVRKHSAPNLFNTCVEFDSSNDGVPPSSPSTLLEEELPVVGNKRKLALIEHPNPFKQRCIHGRLVREENLKECNNYSPKA